MDEVSLRHALIPSHVQALAMASDEDPRPVVMLNLLRFRDRASYEDGRETTLSGREAYLLYGMEMQKIVASRGGEIVFTAAAERLVIGEGTLPWHLVALMRYPSAKAFIEIVRLPEVAKISVHRKAGLEGQLLILTRENEAA